MSNSVSKTTREAADDPRGAAEAMAERDLCQVDAQTTSPRRMAGVIKTVGGWAAMLVGLGMIGYGVWDWASPLEQRVEIQLEETGPVVDIAGVSYVKFSGEVTNRSWRTIRCLGASPC